MPPTADVVKQLTCRIRSVARFSLWYHSRWRRAACPVSRYIPEEKPAASLQRLQVALTLSVKRGGASGKDTFSHNFVEVVGTISFLLNSNYKQKRTNPPPTFSQLLSLLCKDNNNRSEVAKELSKQVAEIQSHLVKLTNLPRKQKKNKNQIKCPKNLMNKSRPWSCFQCGEDGHIKPHCENEPTRHGEKETP